MFSGHLEILFWCLNVFIGDPHLFLWSFELTCTRTILEFQPIFRTLFWDFVCGTSIHVLFFFLKPPLKFILAHLLYLSWLVDIRIEVRMGSFYSYYWCYVFVVSPGSFVLSIAIAKCHLHLYPIVPPHNHAHPQNPSSFTPHTIHSHHPSHPPSSPFHYSPPAWSSMHIATLIFSL